MPNKVAMEPIPYDSHDIEYLVCHVGLLWRRLLNAKAKALGISGTERRALFAIARHPGHTQAQLAMHLDLEPQNLMRAIDKLEKEKWIIKQSDANDRRVKHLYMTPKAKKIINEINVLSDHLKPLILSGIDPKQLQIVQCHLQKMRENVLAQLALIEK